MPSSPFPEHPDSGKLFARNGVIDAALPLSRLPRFLRCLQDDKGDVAVHLGFGHDSEGCRRVQGSLDVPVQVLCQRCLQPMDLLLNAALDVLVVDDEDSRERLEALRPEAEVLVDAEDALDVLALIEDELLLSLPAVPVHEDEDCSTELTRLRQEAATGNEETAHPFAALAAWKKNRGPDDNGSQTQ